MGAPNNWQVLAGRAVRRSSRVVGTVGSIAAFPVFLSGLDSSTAPLSGLVAMVLAALVSIWLGGVAFFLCYEFGD